jgi:hypothetical protein
MVTSGLVKGVRLEGLEPQGAWVACMDRGGPWTVLPRAARTKSGRLADCHVGATTMTQPLSIVTLTNENTAKHRPSFVKKSCAL